MKPPGANVKRKPSHDAHREGKFPITNITPIIQMHFFDCHALPHRNYFQTTSTCARGTDSEATVSHLAPVTTAQTTH